jgi:hypothetical protein
MGQNSEFMVRRIDDEEEFTLLKIYRRPQYTLADVASPGGREKFTMNAVEYFADAPDGPTRVVGGD